MSKDLIHWQPLAPSVPGDKKGGVAGGSVVVDVNNTSGLQAGKEKPLPYDAALHAKAENDKNYRSLLREVPLTTTTDGPWTLVSVPALNPWGILLVEKLQ